MVNARVYTYWSDIYAFITPHSFLPSSLHPFRMTTDDSGLAWITTRAGSGRKFKQGENVTLSYRGFLLEDFWSPSNGFLKPGLGLAFDSNAEYKTDLSNVRKNETHLCVPLPACVRHGVSSLPCVRANDSTDRFQHEAQLRTVATLLQLLHLPNRWFAVRAFFSLPLPPLFFYD